jgi:hypothetical protein
MTLNTKRIITDIKARHGLGADSAVGLIGSFDAKSTVDRTQRLIRATATTRAIDLDNEVVLPGGADWSYFDANGGGKVFVDHWTDFEHTVGTVRNRQARTALSKDGAEVEAWNVLIHVLDLKKNPYGDDILTIAEECGIGLSIGFIALERGEPTAAEVAKYGGGKPFASIVRRYKLLEISFTCLPCTVQCQTGALTAADGGKAIELLDTLVTKGRISREAGRLFGLERGKKTELTIEGITGRPVEQKRTVITLG